MPSFLGYNLSYYGMLEGVVLKGSKCSKISKEIQKGAEELPRLKFS